MANQPRTKRVRSLHSLVQVGGNNKGNRGHGTSSKLSGKGKKLPFPQDTCYRCGKNRHLKTQDCKALDTVWQRLWEKGDTLRKSVSRLNIPHIHSRFHKLPPVLQGQGPMNPLYFDDDGQPIFTHMVSVPHANKHLIKFPIALDYTTLRSWIEDSTTPPQDCVAQGQTQGPMLT